MKNILLLAVLLSPLPSLAVDFDAAIAVPAELSLNKDQWRAQRAQVAPRVVLVSHEPGETGITGKGIEEMLELVTQRCVTDACRGENVYRQLAVLASVPEPAWRLSAKDVVGILGHTDGGYYYHHADYGNGAIVHMTWNGYGVATGEGPQRFVLRSIPQKVWRGWDRDAVEDVVESLERQNDRVLAIAIWMEARQ